MKKRQISALDRARRFDSVPYMGKITKNEKARLEYQASLLSQRLTELRLARALTLEQVEKRSGIPRATLSRIERGGNSPSAAILAQLSEVYGLTISQLFVASDDNGNKLLPYAEALRWQDTKTGFERAILSPPATGFAVEIIEGTLPAATTINYDRCATSAMEQHIILLSGSLDLDLAGQTFKLRQPKDCLRIKLVGPSSFHNPGKTAACYILVQRKPI